MPRPMRTKRIPRARWRALKTGAVLPVEDMEEAKCGSSLLMSSSSWSRTFCSRSDSAIVFSFEVSLLKMTSVSAGLASASAGAVGASSRRMLPIVPRRVGLAHSFSGRSTSMSSVEGTTLSAMVPLGLVPSFSLLRSLLLSRFLDPFLDLLFRHRHPGGWFEAFLRVLAMNGVHDVLNLGPSTALHKASARTRASTIP